VAIFRSAPIILGYRGNDYPYRQDSDFYYLTGFEEPESVCILAPNHTDHRFVLFVQPRNREEEIWEGERAGVEGAEKDYGAEKAYPIDQLDEILPTYLENCVVVYYGNGQGEAFDERVIELIKRYRPTSRSASTSPTVLADPGDILDEMRLIKQDNELELLRKAASITAEAHKEAMKATRPGTYEYEIQAVVEYIFRKHGSPRNAYESIVASGPNATFLHYAKNNRRMEDGELLLIDAGAEYGYYAADITRTFPVNGRFSPEQREIYELVLKAQLVAINKIKPGVSLMDIHKAVVQSITEGLLELGILQGEVTELMETEAYSPFFMHQTSHLIGLDLRDRGKYFVNGQSRILEPGMVFTVEPGIYIADGTENVNEKYWNIGVRIEDDVHVTKDGYEILTSQVPKTVVEIEELLSRR
jgi:Xaa-Pro aminopeptidase